MDFNKNEPRFNGFVKASMALGILTIVSAMLFTIYFPFVFGGLAIILALLSKGNCPMMHKKAKIGVIAATIGLVLNIFIVSTSFYMIFSSPQYMEELNAMSEQLYGQTFDESIDQIINGTF